MFKFDSRRPGIALVSAIVTMIVVAGVAAVVLRYTMTNRQSVEAHHEIATGDFSAESLVRLMSDRLISKAESKLGMLTPADIEELNAEIPGLPIPENVVLDVEATKYVLAGIEDGEIIPYDQSPLGLIPDQPRANFDIQPDFGGVSAARTLEVVIIASVKQEPEGYRTAMTRLAVSKVLPYQRVVYTAGPMEICASPGTEMVIQGRVWADGTLYSACEGSRTFAGEIYAQDAIEVDDVGTHSIAVGVGHIPLTDLSADQARSNVGGTIAASGGRVTIGAGYGGNLTSSIFQSDAVAGSGECPDFDGACGGASQYNPSVTISKSTPASSSSFDVTCGNAYLRIGRPDLCESVIHNAVTYYTYPFTSTNPQPGWARKIPSTDQYWNGLYPDYRREDRCNAVVAGDTIRTWRCDTNSYGYVIDMSKLLKIEGGLLSIRKSTGGPAFANPSGYQEIAYIRNADVLYAPLTIHSEIPVVIVGNFNVQAPKPAMIDAPLITVLPRNAEAQLATRALWDSVGVSVPLRSAEPVHVHAVLRSRYQPTDGGNYYGGTIEQIPSVVGQWHNGALAVTGVIEARPWGSEPMAYANHFRPYGAEAADVRITQPTRREIEFDDQLARIDRQPPGSWHWMNMPVGNAARDAERQKYAYGGYSVVRMVQEPTRLPRQDALAVVPAPMDSLVDSTPPVIDNLVCTPTTAETGVEITCSIYATAGTDPVQEFIFDWGDGATDFAGAASNRATVTHTYSLPGTYTVRARAYDTQGRMSAVAERQITIQPSPPEITATCSPSEVKPNQPDGSGEPTACSISAIAGSHPLKEYHVSWGDGLNSNAAASGSSWDVTHVYQNEGTYTVEMFAVDSAGLESNRVTTMVRARHLPPRITSWTCYPAVVTPKSSTTCTAVVEKGTTDATTLSVNWGDGYTPSATLSGTSAMVTHQYSSAIVDSTYTVVAIARDQAGLTSDPATFEVILRIGRPESEVWCSETTIYEGDSVTCEVRTVSEGSFPVRSYYFDWGDGSGVTTRTSAVSPAALSASHVYSASSDVFFRGWVADSLGNLGDVDSLAIKILPYTPPVADSISCNNGSVLYDGDTVTCTLYGKPGTFPLESFVFDWGTGPKALPAAAAETEKSDSHSYGVGTHTVTAWVVDKERGTRSNQVTKSFTFEPRIPPAVTLTCDETSLNAGQTTTCRINASVSSPAVVDTIAYDNGSGTLTKVSAASLPYSFNVTSSSAGNVVVRGRARGSHGVWSTTVSETVTFVSVKPEITSFTCPSNVNANTQFTCSVAANGGTGGIARYVVDWGNGAIDTVKTTATSASLKYTYPPSTPTKSMTVRVRACGSACSDEVSRVVSVTAVPVSVSYSASAVYVKAGNSFSFKADYNGGGAVVEEVYYEIKRGGTTVESGRSYPNKTSGSVTISAPTSQPGEYSVIIQAKTAVGTAQDTSTYSVVTPIAAALSLSATDIRVGGSGTIVAQAVQGENHRVSIELVDITDGKVLCSSTASGVAQCSAPMNTGTGEVWRQVTAVAMAASGNSELNAVLGRSEVDDEYFVYQPPTATLYWYQSESHEIWAYHRGIHVFGDRTVASVRWTAERIPEGWAIVYDPTNNYGTFIQFSDCVDGSYPVGTGRFSLEITDSKGYKGIVTEYVGLYLCSESPGW